MVQEVGGDLKGCQGTCSSLLYTVRPTQHHHVPLTQHYYGSLAFTDGNGYGHGQDLGKAGSCVQQFHPLPFVMCQGRGDQGTCSYAFRNEYSYWLSTMSETMYGEVPSDQTLDFISRCSVCKINAAVITVHSMTSTLPDCPDEWLPLWEGYSYLMVWSYV